MVDLRSLEVFYWVLKLGGFGRAAERLNMTQPAVSARIGQKEAMFVVSLLDRSRRIQAATPRGFELLDYAERMLAPRSEMVARLTGPADLLGTVRIGAAEALVHTLTAPLLRVLSQDHPRLTPEVTVDISPNLQLGLLGGELDVVLMLGPSNDPRIQSVALRDYELVWVAAPSLALPDGVLGPAALAQFPVRRGGDGVVRRLRFREAMTAVVVASRRTVLPFGWMAARTAPQGANGSSAPTARPPSCPAPPA